MPDYNNIEEASAAISDMFAAQQAADEADADRAEAAAEQAAAEETVDEAQVDADEASRQAEEAGAIANAAAQAAQERDNQLNALNAQYEQMMQQMQAIAQENEQLKSQMHDMYEGFSEQQRAQEAAVIEQAEADDRPVLDLDELQFLPEDERQAAINKYADDMRDYTMRGVLESPEIAELVRQAQDGRTQREREEALSEIEKYAETANVRAYLPYIDRIMQNNPYFTDGNMPMVDKVLNAYMIARGAEALQAKPKEMSVDDLMGMYHNNPDFAKAIEQERLAAVKEGQQVPTFAPSDGDANAAVNIPEKPGKVEDVAEKLRKLWK